MTEYRVIGTNEVVHITPYEDGMEEGMNFYSLTGAFISFMTKEQMTHRGIPRTNRIPTLLTKLGYCEIKEDDFILTYSDGSRIVVNQEYISKYLMKTVIFSIGDIVVVIKDIKVPRTFIGQYGVVRGVTKLAENDFEQVEVELFASVDGYGAFIIIATSQELQKVGRVTE